MSVVNRLLAVGGETTEASPLAESYDPSAKRWRWIAPMRGRRVAAAGAVLDGAVYVSGGRNAQEETERTCEVWDPVRDAWTSVKGMDQHRHEHALVAWDGHLYAIGGSHRGRLATVERYERREDRWDQVTPLPVAMSSVVGHVVDGHLWAIGATEYGAAQVVYQVWQLDARAERWARLDQLTTRRRWPAVAAHGTSIYVIGGQAGDQITAEVQRFEVGGGEAPPPPPIPTARCAAATAVFDDRLYVIGGALHDRTPTGAVEGLDLTGGGWHQAPSLGYPRAGLCAVVLPL